jgi:hypothetical protein
VQSMNLPHAFEAVATDLRPVPAFLVLTHGRSMLGCQMVPAFADEAQRRLAGVAAGARGSPHGRRKPSPTTGAGASDRPRRPCRKAETNRLKVDAGCSAPCLERNRLAYRTTRLPPACLSAAPGWLRFDTAHTQAHPSPVLPWVGNRR